MIEFSCPSCQALIRVADGAGGKKGTCPQCQSKIVVPESSDEAGRKSPSGNESSQPNPPFEFKPAEDDPSVDPQGEGVMQDSVSDVDSTTAPLIDVRPEDQPGTTVRRSRRRESAGGGLVVPLVCAAILLGAVGFYVWRTQTGLSPEVTGMVVADPAIPDGLIVFGNVSVDKELFEKVRKSLQEQSLALVSSTQLADVTLTGNISGIVTKVKPVAGAVCVKVSIDGTKVEEYVSDHAKELNEYRMERIRETADRFITEWAAAIDAGEREIPRLNDARNDMALASAVTGFGYHVVAWDGNTVSPCVGADTSGDLYFFVKPGTKQFVIRGRKLEGETPGFPGEIVVNVPPTAKGQLSPAQPSAKETPPESGKTENGTTQETPQGDPESDKTDSAENESSSRQ